MKPETFSIPGSLYIERSLRKEGPSPVYVAWVPNSSRMFYETAPLLKFCKWPKSTPSGQALREWLAQFEQAKEKAPDVDQEPNANTKTII